MQETVVGNSTEAFRAGGKQNSGSNGGGICHSSLAKGSSACSNMQLSEGECCFL